MCACVKERGEKERVCVCILTYHGHYFDEIIGQTVNLISINTERESQWLIGWNSKCQFEAIYI